MMRGARVATTVPNSAFTCCPFGWNRAAVLTLENWVWLKVLYASQRSEKNRLSLLIGKCFVSAVSMLFTPGLRTVYLPKLPGSFEPGRQKAAVLNHWENV